MDEKHETLNLRLAEIDGKKHSALNYCTCGGRVTYGVNDLSNSPHYRGLWCKGCDKPYMDYLTPSNLHELVRIADEQFIYWRFAHDKGGYYVSVGLDNEQVRSESLSAALAEAIVEAKG